ncbi:hypothetical protein LTS15_008408 [Exophiala xenobiotica]|nr:hypothetical protein LTS15_008408 [Exophiala xenobiotica]
MAPTAVLPATDLFAMTATRNYEDDYYSKGLRARFRLDGLKNLKAPAEVSKPAPHARIGYDVDEKAFRQRSEIRLATGGLPDTVPEGWPQKLEGALVWNKDHFQDEAEYVYYLTDADKADIRGALEYFKG